MVGSVTLAASYYCLCSGDSKCSEKGGQCAMKLPTLKTHNDPSHSDSLAVCGKDVRSSSDDLCVAQPAEPLVCASFLTSCSFFTAGTVDMYDTDTGCNGLIMNVNLCAW